MLPRFFKQSDDLRALYAGKSLEKLLDRIARCQMIEETLNRNASSGKNRLSAKNLGILRYDGAHGEQNLHQIDRRKIDLLLRSASQLSTNRLSAFDSKQANIHLIKLEGIFFPAAIGGYCSIAIQNVVDELRPFGFG